MVAEKIRQNIARSIQKDLSCWVAVVFFSVVAARYLFFPPIYGIADNKDFWRVMFPSGIRYLHAPDENQTFYVERIFGFAATNFSGPNTGVVDKHSSISAVVYPARILAAVFSDTFDLRILGLIYFSIFVSGLFFFLRLFRSWFFSLGVVWISLEPTVFLHFNSFYLIAVYLCVWPWFFWGLVKSIQSFRAGQLPGVAESLALGMTGFWVTTSKPQFFFFSLSTLLFLRLFFRSFKSIGFSACEFLLLAGFLGAVWIQMAYPKTLSRVYRYQAVFNGIGLVASDPDRAFATLGISKEFVDWRAKHLPTELVRNDFPDELANSLKELSYLKLLWLYISDPRAIVKASSSLIKPMSKTTLPYGNYERDTGVGMGQLTLPWQFSGIRDPILAKNGWLVFLIPILGLIVVLLGFSQTHFELVAISGFLGVQIVTQWVLCVVADGFTTLHRHLVIARHDYDLLFLCLVLLFLKKMIEKRKEVKDCR